jgi:hypothetical protein
MAWTVKHHLRNPQMALEGPLSGKFKFPALGLLLACSWPALGLLLPCSLNEGRLVTTYWNPGPFGQDRPRFTCMREFFLFLQALQAVGGLRQVRIGLRPQPWSQVSVGDFGKSTAGSPPAPPARCRMVW